MSALSTIGICWLGLNGALFVALATRKSRRGVRARLFNWVIRNEPKEPYRAEGIVARNGSAIQTGR
jgi:hypothetical protein